MAAGKLQKVTQVALDLEKAGVQSVGKTVEQFKALGEEPVKASLKLNEQYKYLTLAVYNQIKALEDQGQKDAAASLAQDTYQQAMATRTAKLKENLGDIERAWDKVIEIAKKGWDAILGIGRPQTLQGQIKSAVDEYQAIQEEIRNPTVNDGMDMARQKRLEQLRTEISALQDKSIAEQKAATAQAEGQKATDAGLRLSRLADQYASKDVKMKRELAAAEQDYATAISKTTDEQVKASLKAQLNQAKAGITAKYADKSRGARGPSASADASTALARIKANLNELQSAIKDSDAIVVQALNNGKVGINAAYQARLNAIETGAQAQREAIEAEIAAVDRALAKAKPGERAGLEQKKIKLEAELKANEASLQKTTRDLDQWRIGEEHKLSSITAHIRVEVANITGQFDAAAVRAQIEAQYADAYKAAGWLNSDQERADQRASIDLLVQAGQKQAEFNARLAEAQRIQSALAVQEQAIQVLRDKGSISAAEATARLAQARADAASSLQGILPQLASIRDSVPAGAAATIDGMNVSLGQLKNTVDAATPSVVDLGTKLKNTVLDNLSDAAVQAVTNFKGLGDFVANMLKQMAADIMRSGIKSLLTDQFKVDGSGGGSGIFGAIFSGVKGLFGFAGGGHVQGPGSATSDSIPALVSNGEFVQPTRAVRHYGLGMMEAIRTLQLPRPRYGFGGLVQAHQSAQRAQRYASGGAVTGGAQQQPGIVINMTNNGTAKQQSGDAKVSRESNRYIIDVLLEDAQAGGRGIRGIKSALARG